MLITQLKNRSQQQDGCDSFRNTKKISTQVGNSVHIKNIKKPRTIISYHNMPATLQAIIQQLTAKLLLDVRKATAKFNVDLNTSMNYLRAHIVFQDAQQVDPQIVEQLIGQYSHNKMQYLQTKLKEKQQTISQMQRQMNQQMQFGQKIFKKKSIGGSTMRVATEIIQKQQQNEPKIDFHMKNPLAQKLYNKANKSSLQQFQQYYRQMTLQHRLQLVNVKNIKKNSIRNTRHLPLQSKIKSVAKIDSILEQLGQTEINQMRQKLGIYQCPNPSCKYQQQQNIKQSKVNIERAYTISESHKRLKNLKNCYKSDKINEYYARYYKSNFKIGSVISVQRTKTQEMQGLYMRHKRKQHRRHRTQHCRSKSIA